MATDGVHLDLEIRSTTRGQKGDKKNRSVGLMGKVRIRM